MLNAPLAPEQASNFAPSYDLIFWVLTALTAFFTLLVAVLVITFAVRYRRGTKVDRSRPHHENLPLEITWTGIPMLLGLVMFFFGARLFIEMRVPPKDAQEIYVIGKQWMWHIQHANGVRENNTLHVPLGKPIKLTMISQDVIHAFYIPAFRQQMHVVPGRYTQMWFTPTKEGRYPLFCGMYCGTQHSEMGGYVYVMSQQNYAQWLANGGNNVPQLSLAERGERLFKVLGCANNCHGETNTANAPTLYGVSGTRRQMADGSTVQADQEYLRESIIRPWNRLTAGYGNTMPAYEGQVSEEDILALTTYIQSLGAPSGDPSGAVALRGGNAASATSGRTPNRPVATNAMEAQYEINPGQTELPRTGAAVNAIAAQNRTEGR